MKNATTLKLGFVWTPALALALAWPGGAGWSRRTLIIACLAAGTLLAGERPLRAGAPGAAAPPAQPGIPYVPTRHDAVRDLLWLADVGTNDVVYDLGSGDGRVVIAAVRGFGARKAVGIER